MSQFPPEIWEHICSQHGTPILSLATLKSLSLVSQFHLEIADRFIWSRLTLSVRTLTPQLISFLHHSDRSAHRYIRYLALDRANYSSPDLVPSGLPPLPQLQTVAFMVADYYSPIFLAGGNKPIDHRYPQLKSVIIGHKLSAHILRYITVAIPDLLKLAVVMSDWNIAEKEANEIIGEPGKLSQLQEYYGPSTFGIPFLNSPNSQNLRLLRLTLEYGWEDSLVSLLHVLDNVEELSLIWAYCGETFYQDLPKLLQFFPRLRKFEKFGSADFFEPTTGRSPHAYLKQNLESLGKCELLREIVWSLEMIELEELSSSLLNIPSTTNLEQILFMQTIFDDTSSKEVVKTVTYVNRGPTAPTRWTPSSSENPIQYCNFVTYPDHKFALIPTLPDQENDVQVLSSIYDVDMC
jgi:hypothetical protein